MLGGSEPFLGPANRGVASMVVGLVLVLIFAVAAVIGMLKIRVAIAWLLPVAVVGLVVGLWYLWRKQAQPFRWSKNGSFSDPSARLRIIGEGARTEPVLAAVVRDSFDPVIVRSLSGVTLASFLPTPEQLAGAATSKPSERFNGWGLETRSSLALRAEAGLFTAVIAAVIVGIHLRMFGTWSGISAPHIIGAWGLASVVRALLRPEYIRIAPGVIDVFRYPILGLGTPRFERFNLRAASVAVDLPTGATRIHDPSRGDHPVAYLSLRSMIGRPTVIAAALFSAAQSNTDTPPLPTDELLG